MGAAEPKCLLVLLVPIFLLGLGGRCEGCWELEKLGLLQLKPFFNLQQDHFGVDSEYALYDWVEDKGNKSSDCCKWERVECDATTGRVIKLYFANRLSIETFFTSRPDLPGWYLNASLFLPFEELKSLSLSGNRIIGCLDNEGFEKLALKLKKLEFLDLSFNHFDDGSILSSLVEFSSLKSLNLSHNQLSETTHTGGFGELSKKLSTIEILDLQGNQLGESILASLSKMSSIKYLDLSSNFITAELMHNASFKGLSRLRSLETLNLSNNDMLDNSILSRLGDFSSLKTLALQNCGLKGTIHIQELNKLINLKELDLGDNEIKSLGSFHDKDERLSGLINLEVLALTFNILNNSILSSLGPFSKCLKHLYVSDNWCSLDGSINIKDARNLKNLSGSYAIALSNSVLLQQSLSLFPSLKTLHFVSYADTSFNAPVTLKRELRNFTNLEQLEVYNVLLPINFIEDVRELTSLRVLSLSSGNGGSLPIQDICQLKLLEKLDIKQNILRGVLPDCFSNLMFLGYLDLSSNQISGDLATSPLQSLTSIEYIDLSNNQFQIPISLKPFFNHSKLKYFHGDNNQIYAETELSSLTPRFQLKDISLSCCGDAGPLPEFLFHQHELQSVDLSNINLTGEFPSWLLVNNTELETLFLINNSLSGNFRLSFHSSVKLLELDVSNNFIDGHIPVEIGVCLPSLRLLNISINFLDGSIPTSIGDMKLLRRLDLSHNRLSGVLPEALAVGCTSLEFLVLSNNRLQGQIFSANFNLTNLNGLYLAGNNFTGLIPDSLLNCPLLSKIDLGYNHLSGRIPSSIANLSDLQIFSIPNNHIEGPIPMEFCQNYHIGVLDLSMNNISGTLASCFGSEWNNHVHLSKNRLQGPIPKSICNSSRLVTLDLSDNQLTGNIPNCISNLSELRFLVLNHNNLGGKIPNQFCQLDKLSLIDLSHNNFYGRIPNCLNVTAYEGETPSDVKYELTVSPYGPPAMVMVWYETDGSIDLTTKNRSYSYKGRILRYLSGIDLSSNKLTGQIPHEMGNFHNIVMLNLSHNSLSESIPQSLSNLKAIESLDLSYNNLSGSIPFQLVELYSLAYFNVSYNNLSGRPPPRTAQFATDFDENSYWGNPLLCGEPLPKNCSTTPNPPMENEEDVGLVDMKSFYVTFIMSYLTVLLSIAIILYINPHWRQAWFYLIERGINSCFYFVDNILPKQLHLW